MSAKRRARQSVTANESSAVPESKPRSAPSVRSLLKSPWLVLFVAYLFVFFTIKLPGPDIADGALDTRIERLKAIVLIPDELARDWFGEDPYILDRLPVLAIEASILLVICLLGWTVLRWFAAGLRLDRLECCAFSFGVGLSLVSLFGLTLGLCGGLHQPGICAAAGAIVILVAVATFFLKKHQRPATSALPSVSSTGQASAQMPTSKSSPKTVPAAATIAQGDPETSAGVHDQLAGSLRLGKGWLLLCLPFVLVLIVGGILPPINFDVREYHLQAPKEFFQAGRIHFLPHNVYGNMNLGAEMIPLLAMVVSQDWWLGALAGKGVIALIPIFTAIGILAAARRYFSQSAGIFAAIGFLSIPWVIENSTNGLVEGASCLYLLLAWYAMCRWRESTASRGFLILSGFMAGSAVAFKYPGALFVFLPLAIWSAVGQWKSRGAEHPIQAIGKVIIPFLLAGMLAWGPWLAKNWALSGNPTYPLLYGVFGGETRTPEKDAQWKKAHAPPNFSAQGMTESIVSLLFNTEWLSPLTWPLAALGLIAVYPHRVARRILYMILFNLAAWWLFTHRIDRFWMPILPLLAILGGAACQAVSNRWGRALWITTCLLVFTNALFAAYGKGIREYRPYFQSLAALRDDTLRVKTIIRALNSHREEVRMALFVGEAEVFDSEVPTLYNTCFDDVIWDEFIKDKDSKQVYDELVRRNISHIYVDWAEIDRYRQPGNYGFKSEISVSLFEKMIQEGNLALDVDRNAPLQHLYKVRPPSRPAKR